MNQPLQRAPGQQQAEPTADGGKQQALHQLFPDQAHAPAAQCCPNGELPVARSGSCYQQAGDVHAGDEQDTASGSEQRIERGFVILYRVIEHGSADDVVVHAGAGMCNLDLFLQSSQPCFESRP